MKLKDIILLLFLLISAFLFFSFKENRFVWLSFFANWGVLTIICLYHLKIERGYSPFLSAYVTFNYLFFLVAPMVQISALNDTNNLFPNYFPYSGGKVIYTNMMILISHVVLFCSYLFFKKEQASKKAKTHNQFNHKYTPLNVLLILGISIVALVMSYDYLLTLWRESHWTSNITYKLSVSSKLMLHKVVYVLPLGALVLGHSFLRKKNSIKRNRLFVFLIMIFLFIILLFFKNPLTEKRNAIGPIYITLLFLFQPKLLNSNTKSFIFLFFSLVVFFPLVSGLTHLDAPIDQIISEPKLVVDHFKEQGIVQIFNTLHYDAFANVMATIDYVSKTGISYGYQILSGLLFFVPRSIWTSKPYSTGEVIGDYVIEGYGFEYNNLSNPLVSEGYVNFGVLGVILMALALGYFMIKFINWLQSNDPLKRIMAFYFAVHLLFLLRGDFTNGFTYFIGTLIGVLFVPKLIDKLIRMSLRKTTK
tara:strand:+ start:3998 stop:5425 length:1428 start_codon:yes stop_codon:yes gene_type:complete